MFRATNAAEIADFQLIGREVWAQPVIGHAIVGELLEVRGDTETLVIRSKHSGEEIVRRIGHGFGPDAIEHLTWQVPAEQVKPGDRYRSMGPGFIARTVATVETVCNCQASVRRIDPVTGEAQHQDVVIVTSDSREPERYHARPGQSMWITTPESF